MLTFYQAGVLLFGLDGGPIPGFTRRADHSFIVGASLSALLHALVIPVLRTVERSAPSPAIPPALPSRVAMTLPAGFDPARIAARQVAWP